MNLIFFGKVLCWRRHMWKYTYAVIVIPDTIKSTINTLFWLKKNGSQILPVTERFFELNIWVCSGRLFVSIIVIVVLILDRYNESKFNLLSRLHSKTFLNHHQDAVDTYLNTLVAIFNEGGLKISFNTLLPNIE